MRRASRENGNGVLLIGASRTGKSTLACMRWLAGCSCCPKTAHSSAPKTLRATGVPNYLHLAPDSPRFVRPGVVRRAIERSPVIQRRSRARKFEVDVRKLRGQAPARAVAARRHGLSLAPRRRSRATAERARSRRVHPAAAPRATVRLGEIVGLAGIRTPHRRVAGSYELRRTEHPGIAAQQLCELLWTNHASSPALERERASKQSSLLPVVQMAHELVDAVKAGVLAVSALQRRATQWRCAFAGRSHVVLEQRRRIRQASWLGRARRN